MGEILQETTKNVPCRRKQRVSAKHSYVHYDCNFQVNKWRVGKDVEGGGCLTRPRIQ